MLHAEKLDFGEVLDNKNIVVCAGPGGVGKTTSAAALAIAGAKRGRNTLVLTIDPAKRLANSLGLSGLGHDVLTVPPQHLSAIGPVPGRLDAMMLDQKRAFDEMVQRYATDAKAVERIMANPVYQQIAGSLAGSQEYAALAQLETFVASGDYDLIVVDTPPTSHALDFLEAPQKLADAIDSPAVEWFRKIGNSGEWSVVGRTGSYVLKRLSKFVGTRFLNDLGVFFTEFNDILGGFRQRAQSVFELLRNDNVGFVLVTSPDAIAISEVQKLYQRLLQSRMTVSGVIVNKVHKQTQVASQPTDLAAEFGRVLRAATPGRQPDDSVTTTIIEQMLACHQAFVALAHGEQRSIGVLRDSVQDNLGFAEVPLLGQDIYHVAALAQLGEILAPTRTVLAS